MTPKFDEPGLSLGQMPPSLPGRLFATGVVLVIGGYATLNLGHLARSAFWIGLVFLLSGAALWLAQPPRKRTIREDEPEPASDEHDDNTVSCPHCGAAVYEGGLFCPNCQRYLSREDAPVPPKPLWFLVGLAAALGLATLWILNFP
jgi:hypothetical protein